MKRNMKVYKRKKIKGSTAKNIKQMNTRVHCPTKLLSAKETGSGGSGQVLAVEWSVQTTVSLSSHQYSLIIYRYSLCPGEGQPCPWVRMAPARLPPAGPARSHSHPGEPGSPTPTILLWRPWLCFVCWPWRRGLLPSPAELEPRVPPAPSWSSTQAPPIPGFWLAGCPVRP